MTGPRPIQNRRDFVWAAVMMLVAFATLSGFGILYTNHEMREADQRWCELFIGLDDNYRAAPPGSLAPRQQKFANQIRDLRLGLHCEDTPQPPIQSPTSAPAPSRGPTTSPTR